MRMPKKKSVSGSSTPGVKTERKIIHNLLRRGGVKVVDLVTQLENIDQRTSMPSNPFREQLGEIEEYYNSMADEFDDMPGEPPMSTVEEAYAKSQAIHREAFGQINGRQPEAAKQKPLRARNRGPNADSASDLYSDALEMLRDASEMLSEGNAKDAAETVIESLKVFDEIEVIK